MLRPAESGTNFRS